MHYILKIGDRLFFRRKVPLELQGILGITEIRRSLRTCGADDAKLIAAHINQQIERVLVGVRSGIPLDILLKGIDLKLRKRHKPSGSKPPTVAAMYQRFADEMVATRQWNDKTVNENRLALNMFLTLMGDMPIPTVTHAILMEYRSMIQRLPPNSTKGKATRTTPLRDLVKMVHKRTVSLTRVNHILMPLTGLFRWLQKHEIIKDNPAHSLLLPKGRHNVRPDEQRKRYTSEQVRHIIDAVQDFKVNQPERFWIPCIAAFSAMRVNEIAQLYLDDLQEIDKIWCFEIVSGKDKRVKNLSSHRTVPIHPLLQQWGLLEYAADRSKNGADRLFPGLRRHRRNGYAHQIIAWWSRFKGRISSDPRLSFHSLRHSACDEMKQNKVDPAVIAEILGHSSGSITMERYGKRFASKILLDAIISINYGYDV